jgi:hypothetical protein
MADKQPNIVVFSWNNFGWGKPGCYGGGVLRRARRRGSTTPVEGGVILQPPNGITAWIPHRQRTTRQMWPAAGDRP